jgi:hypothetical protein
MTRPRCADDFAMIRARVAELRRQRAPSTGDEDARSVTEPSFYPDNGHSVLAQRPGIPGWRVARRKRQFSQT